MLGDAGVYFDPEQPADIARASPMLIESPQLRSDWRSRVLSVHSYTRGSAVRMRRLTRGDRPRFINFLWILLSPVK